MWTSLAISSRAEVNHNLEPKDSTLKYIYHKNRCLYTPRHLSKNVSIGAVGNSRKLKTTNLFIKSIRDQQFVVKLYNGASCNYENQKNKTNTCKSMNGS